jgi:hypothetical protein
MAILPKIVYNFNENDATTIRDYSENGNDGLGTNLTVSTSTRVGNDAVFNGTSDRVLMGTMSSLDGVSDCGFHFGINITSGGSLTKKVLSKIGQVLATYNYSTGVFSFELTVNSGVAIVTDTITTGAFFDLDIVYESDVLTLYKDGVSVDTDNTQSGVVSTIASTMTLGDPVGSAAFFILNEFKLYNEAITTNIITASINQQNGIYTDTFEESGFQLGDVIFTNLETTPLYAVVSWVGTGTDYRFLPLTSGIYGSLEFRRGAHLWDTTRQFGLLIDDTPQICFYDNQTKSTEIFIDAKKTYCITNNGLINPSVGKIDDYTLTNSDHTVYLTGSTAKTFTFPSSPTNDKQWNIINLSTATLTIDGNGNNINGSSTEDLLSKYDSAQIKFINNELVIN